MQKSKMLLRAHHLQPAQTTYGLVSPGSPGVTFTSNADCGRFTFDIPSYFKITSLSTHSHSRF